MSVAWTKPMARATASVITMAIPTAAPMMREPESRVTTRAINMPVKAISDPSDRSIPAVIMTMVSPIAKIPSSATLRRMFCMLRGVKKVPRADVNGIAMHSSTSTITTLNSRDRTRRASRSFATEEGRAAGAGGASAEIEGGSGRLKPQLLELLEKLGGGLAGCHDLDSRVDDVVFDSHTELVQLGL